MRRFLLAATVFAGVARAATPANAGQVNDFLDSVFSGTHPSRMGQNAEPLGSFPDDSHAITLGGIDVSAAIGKAAVTASEPVTWFLLVGGSAWLVVAARILRRPY